MASSILPDAHMKSFLFSLTKFKQNTLSSANLIDLLIYQFEKNHKLYSGSTFAFMIWIAKRDSIDDENFIKLLHQEITPYIPSFQPMILCFAVEGLTYRKDLLSQEIIDQVHKCIINLAGRFTKLDIQKLMTNLKIINKCYQGDMRAYEVIDDELYRLRDELNLRTIATVINSFSDVALIHPFKVHTRMLSTILNRLGEIKDTCTIPTILNSYCQYKKLAEFDILFTKCAEIILKNPEPYFTNTLDMVMLVHSFSKVALCPEILNLVPRYVTEPPIFVRNQNSS